MKNNIHYNPLSGKIKCPLAIAWIAFFIQFLYNYYLQQLYYISYLEVIFSIFLLFSFQSIAVFLSLSNNSNSKNYELFFKISFILSIVNIGFNLLSIIVIFLAFSSKLRAIIQPTAIVEAVNFKVKLIAGALAAVVKVIEIIPFFIFLCYKRKLLKGKGEINLPEMLEDNTSLMSNETENKINY